MSGGETLLTWDEWSDPGGNIRLFELLVEQTDLREPEAEAIVAYLASCEHHAAGPKSKWTAGEMADYYRDRLVETYDHWDEVGEQWLAQHSVDGLLTVMFNAADDIGSKSELHAIVAQVGRRIARNNAANEWWYETGQVADEAMLVCMRCPHVAGSRPVQ